MIQRTALQKLDLWKSSPSHKPLVLRGARQVGKTTLINQFATRFDNYLYLNLDRKRDRGLFSVDDIPTLIDRIHIHCRKRKTDGQTLLFIDEIQNSPEAVRLLRYFKEEAPELYVVAAGSLLETLIDTHVSFPVGRVEYMALRPCSFVEFLNGIGEEYDADVVRSLQGDAIHDRLMNLFLNYIIVGGMPEAVSTFLTTNDMNRVQKVQHDIIEAYKGDMLKYARTEDKPRIRECFESIPAQLARENKKFTFSLIRRDARSSQYQGCLQWIEDAGIIRRCYNLHITELPLDGNADKECFKVYMADSGLFISMLEEGTAWSIMQGNMLSYKGAVFENLMADILGKMGRKLYYFRKDSGLELDFVLRYKGECCPLECKARTGNAKSLQTVLKHPEHYHVFHALKVGDYNVGRSGVTLTIPFYMAFLLTEL